MDSVSFLDFVLAGGLYTGGRHNNEVSFIIVHLTPTYCPRADLSVVHHVDV